MVGLSRIGLRLMPRARLGSGHSSSLRRISAGFRKGCTPSAACRSSAPGVSHMRYISVTVLGVAAGSCGGCLVSEPAALESSQADQAGQVRVLLEGSGKHQVLIGRSRYAGNSHPKLAEDIANHLGLPLSSHSTHNFKNGETGCVIHDSVRDCDVFIIQSTCNPCPNEYLMELLVMMDAIRRGGASRITAIIPLFGYARQDKKDKSRSPITGKLVADMLELAGADRVITVDLHASQLQGFVSYPIDNLYAMPLLQDQIRDKVSESGEGDDVVIVSPDAGGAKRAESLSKKLGADLAIFSKKREKANEVSQMILVGDVRGKKCVIVDDMVDTAGTLCLAASQLVKSGATEVFAACSHGVLSEPALQRLNDSPIKELLLTVHVLCCDGCIRAAAALLTNDEHQDTIPLDEKQKICPKIMVASTAMLLAAAIDRVHTGQSLSHLFDEGPRKFAKRRYSNN